MWPQILFLIFLINSYSFEISSKIIFQKFMSGFFFNVSLKFFFLFKFYISFVFEHNFINNCLRVYVCI